MHDPYILVPQYSLVKTLVLWGEIKIVFLKELNVLVAVMYEEYRL